MRSLASARMASSKARRVPTISTDSGTMFSRLPPLIWPIDSTAGSLLMLSWRLTMVCSAVTTWAETTIGSTPFHGKPPWVCLPLILMRTVSPLANCGPLR